MASVAPILVAALAALAILFLYYGSMTAARDGRQAARLKRRVEHSGGLPAEGRPDLLQSVSGSFWRFLLGVGQKVGPQDAETLSATRTRLVQAGLRKHNAHVIFWGVKSFLALTFLLPVLFSKLLADAFHGNNLLLAFVGLCAAAVGFYLPEIWLSMRLSARKQGILEELPDALDLLVVCVESGMGLDQSINRVVQETAHSSRFLNEELKLLTLEMRAGKMRSEAMKSMAWRIGVEDVSNLVTLVIQSDIFGTSVAQTLRVYSDTMRTKRNQRAEEKAAQLPIKLLFPLIFCIFPALFVIILGPAIINIFFSGK
jgi:tight adherence protein C